MSKTPTRSARGRVAEIEEENQFSIYRSLRSRSEVQNSWAELWFAWKTPEEKTRKTMRVSLQNRYLSEGACREWLVWQHCRHWTFLRTHVTRRYWRLSSWCEERVECISCVRILAVVTVRLRRTFQSWVTSAAKNFLRAAHCSNKSGSFYWLGKIPMLDFYY